MKKICGLFLSFFLSVNFALAESDADAKNNNAFDPQIFSLSKRKERAFDATAANYILSNDDIRRSGATSIPEALRLVPGVQVARMNGNTWAISIRGFNRQFANKLLVMIDGRVVYTTLFAGTVWDVQDYALEDVDHIEVIRGPGGTVWGPNAVNGVINIITKNADLTRGSYVSQIVGNRDTSITEARFGAATASNDSYRVYAKKSVREGLEKANKAGENRDGIKRDQAGFRYDISSIRDNNISIHGDIARGTAQNYFATLPNRNDKDSDNANLVINWDRKVSNKSSFMLNGYFDYDSFSMPVLKRSAQTTDIDFQHFYNFSKDNQFIWGAGYRNIKDSIKYNPTSDGVTPITYLPAERSDNWLTGFVQEKFGLVPDKFYVTIGSKFLRNAFTNFEYQPNIRLAYYPERRQTIWASVSRAVRTPTRGERDITLRNADAVNVNSRQTVLNQGNSQFFSEREVAYELGYRFKPISKLSFDLSSFYNRYSRLRTLEPTRFVGSNGLNPTTNNKGSGSSYGFEFSTKWQATRDWKLEGSYEYFKMRLGLDSDSLDNASILAGVDDLQNAEGQTPNHQVKFRSFYNITPNVEFDNIFYYMGNLEKGYGGADNTMSQRTNNSIPDYVRFDTRLGYAYSPSLNLSFGIQNLFDKRYVEFRNALYNNRTEVGRTFYLKMVWQN